MKRFLAVTLLFLFCTTLCLAATKNKYYGTGLCSNPNYDCITIKKGGSWEKHFPNPVERDLLQRVNRTNMYLYRGRKIAVPHNLEKLTIFDVSPFPLHIKKTNEKTIIIDQEQLAWGAYNADGNLLRWGPISSGKNYCGDIRRECTTVTGIYYVFHKKGESCESNIFPVDRGGGAEMPYCMFMYRGFALHGSKDVPGHRDSHGCVRLFTEDAKWLNQDFVELSAPQNNFRGTKVIVQELRDAPKIKRYAAKQARQAERALRARRAQRRQEGNQYTRGHYRHQRRQRRQPERRRRGFWFFR